MSFWLPYVLGFGCCLSLVIIFWCWRKGKESDVVLEGYVVGKVEDGMARERSRAGTVSDKMAPPEVAEALDKLGRPGDP